MNSGNPGKSLSKRLSNLASAKNLPFKNLLQAFYLERLVARLIASPTMREKLVFKGGYVGLRVYNNDRYTIDLDAVLKGTDIEESLVEVKRAAENDLGDGCWFTFYSQQSIATQGLEKGYKQMFRVGLGEAPADISRCAKVHLDLGVGDVIYPEAVQSQISPLIDGADLVWNVYPIELIIAEKLHAFISRNGDSSRSKDMFDLAFYLPKADGRLLKKSIEKCFEQRCSAIPGSIFKTFESYDFRLARLGWTSVFSGGEELLTFDECEEITLFELKNKVG